MRQQEQAIDGGMDDDEDDADEGVEAEFTNGYPMVREGQGRGGDNRRWVGGEAI